MSPPLPCSVQEYWPLGSYSPRPDNQAIMRSRGASTDMWRREPLSVRQMASICFQASSKVQCPSSHAHFHFISPCSQEPWPQSTPHVLRSLDHSLHSIVSSLLRQQIIKPYAARICDFRTGSCSYYALAMCETQKCADPSYKSPLHSASIAESADTVRNRLGVITKP